jgi:hypothetical protein
MLGFFGDKQINSEHNNILKTDDIRKKVRNFAAPTYQFRTRIYTRCITRTIEEFLLAASDIWAADFNKTNHEEYRYYNVILSEESGIEYDAPEESPKRAVTCVFMDKNWTTESKFTNKQGTPPNITEILGSVCFPATFDINGIEVATIPSGQSGSIKVLKQTGTDEIGSLVGSDWRVDDSSITLKDTDNNTLSTTSVPATESAPIVAPDGTVTVNRDGVFFATQPVRSGGVATVNVQSTANKLPTKSGQSVSYATGDDGDDQRARETSFFHLTNNNPFGNNRRFTGTTGGYHVNSDNTFRDKDGNVTTKALAFPNDIMLDWAYYNGDNLSGQVMMWYINNTTTNLVPVEDREWQNMLILISNLNRGGFTNWKMPNILELMNISFYGTNDYGYISYQPLDVQDARLIWTNQTLGADATRAYRYQNLSATIIPNGLKNSQSAQARLMAVRYGNYSVTGGNVIIS